MNVMSHTHTQIDFYEEKKYPFFHNFVCKERKTDHAHRYQNKMLSIS